VAEQPGRIGREIAIEVAAGQTIVIEKTVAIATSGTVPSPTQASPQVAWLEGAGSFGELLRQHVLAWEQLWAHFPIELTDAEDDWVQPVLRLHIFHLLQTTGPNSVGLDVGVPARGLHGEAYREFRL
jgi:trehalose 6-phosphate phosphatase